MAKTNEFVDTHFPHCPFCNKYTDKASTCEGCKYKRGVEGQTLDKFDPNEVWKEMMNKEVDE